MAERRLPPLYPLRAFEAAARKMSFTLAAEELSIGQSAVSHQIKTLERYFGVPLFYRSKGVVRLTAEGKRLFSACETAFAHLSLISSELPDNELQGTITLASPPLVFNWWLLPRLRAFNKQYPRMSFRFRPIVGDSRLSPGDADVALLWASRISDGFVGERLFEMDYSPVASPRLAASLPKAFHPAVLDGTVFLHENDHSGWSNWLDKAGHDTRSATSGWVFEDPGMMIEAAAEGQGLALGPFPLLDELVNKGRLVRVFGMSIPTQNSYFLTVSSRSLPKPGVRLFWKWFVQHGLSSHDRVLSS